MNGTLRMVRTFLWVFAIVVGTGSLIGAAAAGIVYLAWQGGVAGIVALGLWSFLVAVVKFINRVLDVTLD